MASIRGCPLVCVRECVRARVRESASAHMCLRELLRGACPRRAEWQHARQYPRGPELTLARDARARAFACARAQAPRRVSSPTGSRFRSGPPSPPRCPPAPTPPPHHRPVPTHRTPAPQSGPSASPPPTRGGGGAGRQRRRVPSQETVASVPPSALNATPLTPRQCPASRATSSPVASAGPPAAAPAAPAAGSPCGGGEISQMRAVLSLLPDARKRPAGWKVTAATTFPCIMARPASGNPSGADHSRTVRSSDALAMRPPPLPPPPPPDAHGLQATLVTRLPWPNMGGTIGWPLCVSHIRSVVSQDPETTILPEGSKATELAASCNTSSHWREIVQQS